MSGNPMINKKTNLTNLKKQIDEKSTGQEFIERKDISILNLIDKPKEKEEKVLVGIKLKKTISDKVKSFAYENHMTVSEILEDITTKMFNEVSVNEDALRAYEEKYKKKSKKTKKKLSYFLLKKARVYIISSLLFLLFF